MENQQNSEPISRATGHVNISKFANEHKTNSHKKLRETQEVLLSANFDRVTG
jgi:hypothetical protein